MATTLFDLLQNGLIKNGDAIEFTFKNCTFRAKIIKGGLITSCQLFRPHSSESENVLSHVTSFSSLTSWTEACLQDVLEEYFTRYSSWKRVYHCRTNVTMGEIRDRSKIMNGRVSEGDNTELYREIYRLQKTIAEMSTVLKKHNLYNERWNIKMLVNIEEKQTLRRWKKRKISNRDAFQKVQKLMIES
jgi:hypothetical protein